MLTLATAILLQETGNLRSDISGGYDGLPGLTFKPLLGIFDYDLYGHTYYLYVLAVLAVVFYLIRRIVYSPFGQALTGIRENVRRMHARKFAGGTLADLSQGRCGVNSFAFAHHRDDQRLARLGVALER